MNNYRDKLLAFDPDYFDWWDAGEWISKDDAAYHLTTRVFDKGGHRDPAPEYAAVRETIFQETEKAFPELGQAVRDNWIAGRHDT